MNIDNEIKEIMTFKENIGRLSKIVDKLFKSDKGVLIEEEIALIKLYNKSFSTRTKLDKLTKEMKNIDKDIKKWE